MKIYASRYFENWYMEHLVIVHLHHLLLLMSVDESMLFLSDLSEKLKWDGARNKLQRLKSKYLKKVKESENSFKAIGATHNRVPEITVKTVSPKDASFKFEDKI
jgi:hypothetical protein